MIKKSKHISTFALSVVLLSVIVLVLANSVSQKDTINQNVFIGSLDVGGKSLEQAYPLLKTKAETLEQKPLGLLFKKDQVNTNLTTLGVTIDAKKTLLEAYNAKRTNNLLQNLMLSFRTQVVNLSYSINNDTFASYLDKTFQKDLAVTQDAKYVVKDNTIMVEPEIKGETINKDKLQQDLKKILHEQSSAQSLTIALLEQPAQITQADLNDKLSTVQAIVPDSYTLFYNDKKWSIPKSDILSWLNVIKKDSTISTELDTEKIKGYLTNISPIGRQLKQAPENARLSFDTNNADKINVFAPSKEGQQLMVQESASHIKSDLASGLKTTELFVSVVQPEVSETTLSQAGIVALIGHGESSFGGSSKSRAQNIRIGAERISGTLVKPGEDFSFTNTLGNVDAANGYKPELVIKGTKTIPEYGGGICQVSTTLFRAALNASLPITERHPHSYVVSYYGAPGLDATIYVPKPDLRFKNDTEHYILIQHKIEGSKITFEIYGTPTGKESKIIGPTVLESNPDKSMKTVAYREIYQNGSLLHKDTFYSNYRAPNKVSHNAYD